MDRQTLFDELQEPEAQQEALALLMFEFDNRESQYAEGEIKLIHRIFLYVSSFSKLDISDVPKWFVPPQDVDIEKEIARGSFGSVHHGRWNGAKVVVKSAFLVDPLSRKMFLQEANIWHKLQHSYIVRLYGACHVGNPFFVCEFAANGTLSEYLDRNEDRAKLWEKLHQAARGLQFMHEHGVVHGDLKCNNIVVGGTKSSGDGPAKLMDFGLSFVYSDSTKSDCDLKPEDIGAIQWKAPEVIACTTCGSFASDVYSFGMCIMEAVKGTLPWGTFPDSTVKHKLNAKQLPNRPARLNDDQWNLIKQMCAWEPSDRLTIQDAADALEQLAQHERGHAWTPEQRPHALINVMRRKLAQLPQPVDQISSGTIKGNRKSSSSDKEEKRRKQARTT